MSARSDAPSSLSRTNPVILTVAAAAAAVSGYLIYSTYASQLSQTAQSHRDQRSNVRRRGAVHHRGRGRDRRRDSNTVEHEQQPAPTPIDWTGSRSYGVETIEALPQDQDAEETPMTVDWPLQLSQLPSLVQIRQAYDPPCSVTRASNILRLIHQAYVREWLISNAPFDRLDGLDSSPAVARYQQRLLVFQRLSILGLDSTALDLELDRYVEAISAPAQTNSAADQSIEATNQSFSDTNSPLFADDQTMPDPDVGNGPDIPGGSLRTGQSLKEMLYHIAEQQSRDDSSLHRGVSCNSCGIKPIRGIRWHCANCPDYDLCSDCELASGHNKTHLFFKIKIPAPNLPSGFSANGRVGQNGEPTRESSRGSSLPIPVVYPGNPELMPRTLESGSRSTIAGKYMYDLQELDALYEQFSVLANRALPTSAKEDGAEDEIGMAIDYAAFSHMMIPSSIKDQGPAHPSNLLYNRIFAFYDADRDGFINFDEFIDGLATLQSKHKPISSNPQKRWRRIFQGYDFDDDGYISRSDVLSLWRAYYALQSEIVWDLIAVEEHEREGGGLTAILNPLGAGDGAGRAQRIVESAQPLSASFPEYVASDWRRRRVRAKVADQRGDRRTGNPLRQDPDEQQNQYNNADEAQQQQVPDGHSNSNSTSRVTVASSLHTSRFPPLILPSSNSEQSALYQLATSALNDLLNPLFSAKEKLQADLDKTREERRRRADEIATWEEEQKRAASDPLFAMAMAASSAGTSSAPASTATAQPTAQAISSSQPAGISQAIDNVERRTQEASLADLLRDLGAASGSEESIHVDQSQQQQEELQRPETESQAENPLPEGPTIANSAEVQPHDESIDEPTLPQHRPSTPTLTQTNAFSNVSQPNQASIAAPPPSSVSILSSVLFPSASSSFTPPSPTTNQYTRPASPTHLAYLSSLNTKERELRKNPRGEENKEACLDFAEFEKIVNDRNTSGNFGFLDAWLEGASF